MDRAKSINFKTILLTLAIVGIVAIAIFSIDIILTLFASFVITCAVVPIINKMETKMPRIWAVVLILLAMILGSFLVLIPLISICVNEASNLINTFPNLIDDIDGLLNIKIFGQTLSSLLTLESIKEPLVQGAQSMISNSIVAGKWIVNFITTFFAIAITVFYLAYDEKRLTEKFIEFFPKRQKEKARTILENISQKVGNYIFAQGIAMIFVGVATTIGLLFLNHSHAFLLGVVTCIMDIIPVLGPVIAIGLGVLTSFQNGFVFVLLVLLECYYCFFLLFLFASIQFTSVTVYAVFLLKCIFHQFFVHVICQFTIVKQLIILGNCFL